MQLMARLLVLALMLYLPLQLHALKFICSTANASKLPPRPFNASDFAYSAKPSAAAAQLDLAERTAAELADWATGVAQEKNASDARAAEASVRDSFLAKASEIASQLPEAGTGAVELARGIPFHRILPKNQDKLFNRMGFFIRKLGAANQFLGFITSLLLPSETQVLTDLVIRRFDEVNQKLTNIEQQLKIATKSIRAAQESADTIRTYRDCHNAVRNGASKRSEIMSMMKTARTKRELARLAEEFTNWYENSQLDAQLMNLHRAATRVTTSDVGPNLFQSYAKLHSCSTSRLMELMFGVMHDMELGAELQLAYQFLRNGARRASKQLTKAKRDLYEIRSVFDRHYWHCLSNTKTMASKVVRNLMESSVSQDRMAIASHILVDLETKFHRFNWAVVVGVSDLSPKSTLDAENFFTLPTTPKVLVSFADSEQSLQCSDVNLTRTRLIFNCSSSTCAFFASNKSIGSRSCPGEVFIGSEKGTDWIVSILSSHEAPCSSPYACNGHGLCRKGTGLTKPVCLCEPEFQGETCAIKLDTSEVASKYIGHMRESVRQFSGVHTTVDVYYQLQDVKSNLMHELDRISTCTELNRLKSSETIREALYIANLNSQLLKGTRSVEQFGQLMQLHVGFKNIEYFLELLRYRLLGADQSGFSSIGMVQLFKTCLNKKSGFPACGESYSKSVQRFMTGLVLIDEAVGEALLTYFSWKGNRTNLADQIVIEYLKDGYENRIMQFRDHWKALSCPAFKRPLECALSEWNQRFCGDGHSFEGLKLSVKCPAGLWSPFEAELECKKGSDGRLLWSGEPRCNRTWSQWSSWSSCSVSCGNGTQTKHRCLGDDCVQRDSDSKSCIMIDCCTAQYGEGNFFRCNRSVTNECVSKGLICDGTPDCSDASDELLGCKFVRAGNRVAFHFKGAQSYTMNCNCASRCLFQPIFCALKYCSNWENGCPDSHAHFYIYSPERNPGDLIHSGDTIGLMYDWPNPYKWLSCSGMNSRCTVRSCPGDENQVGRVNRDCGGEKFVIYSVRNEGRCRGQLNCAGPPIRLGEMVALKHQNGWVSGPAFDSSINIRNCLQSASMIRSIGCPGEIWKIHVI